MYVTKPADPTGFETWLTPPRMAQRMLARRAAAVVVALSLGLGGSLLAVGAASAEEAPITSETSSPEVPADPIVEPPADIVEGPEVVDPATPVSEPVAPQTLESSVAEVDPASEHLVDNVGICHWKPSAKNPYTYIPNVSVNSIVKDGGHGSHPNDVIPQFFYLENQVKKEFLGLNPDKWAMLDSGDPCGVPDPTVVVTPDVCTVKGGTTSSATIKLNNLVKGEDYKLSVLDKDGKPIGTFTPKDFKGESATEEIVVTGLPAPGDYKAVLEWDELPNGNFQPAAVVLPIKYSITVEFSLVKCPPGLAETGANGSALPIGIGLLAVGSALMLATRLMRREQLFPPTV